MTTNTLPKAVVALAACLAIHVTPVLAEPGDLDPTFGTGGKATMNFDNKFAEGVSMALQSDGKIVVAGTAVYLNEDFAVVRYNTDGSPDSTFGNGGKVSTPILGSSDLGSSVAIQSDGKIVVAGSAYTSSDYDGGTDYDFALVRYNVNGSLDTTFGGGDGKATIPHMFADRASSVAATIDGKILVAGGNISTFTLCRLNGDGTLDASFGRSGNAGYTWADFGDYHNHSFANAMAVQPDGRIVLAGRITVGGLQRFALARFLLTGDLDPTFAGSGMVIVGVGAYDNGANSVLIQSDGKILVGGYSDNGSGQNFALVRLSQLGILDPTFTGGVVTTDIRGTEDACTSVAVQSDGKIVAAGYAESPSDGMPHFAVARYTSQAILDTTFGNMGKVTTDNTGQGRSVAVQSDGKILVAGGSDFMVARYIGPAAPEIAVEQPAGTDLTNGGAGIVFGKAVVGGPQAIRTFTVRNAGTSSLTGLAVNKDGANAGDFMVGNLGATNLPMGASTTFTVVFAPSALGSRTAAIHIASNDADENPFDIALEGTGVPPLAIATASPLPVGTVGAEYDFTLTANGGTTAYTWSVIGGSLPSGLSLSSAGLLSGTPVEATNASFTVRVAGGGSSSATKTFSLRIMGSFEPGALDTSFGSGGKLTTAIGSSHDRASGLAVQSDGKLVVAGSSFNGSNYDFAAVRYLPNGSLDTSFGIQGMVTTPVGNSQDYGWSVAVQSDGKIVVAGDSRNSSDSDFALVRYNANGTLDTGFGSGGKVTTSFSGTSGEAGQSVAVQSDGKIVVAGYSDNGTVHYDFALVRYQADGTLDSTFGTGGKVTTPIGSGDDYGCSVAVQSDGKIVVAGYAESGSGDYDFALVRYLSDGSLDTTFGTGGKVITPVGLYNDSGQSVAVQSDGKIVVAGHCSNGGIDDYDFALVRYLANGSLDTTFGSGGKVITDIGTHSDDGGHGVVVQSDGKIVVAGNSYNGDNYDFALVRYQANGTLDTSFGNGGKMVTAVGGSDDFGWSVAVQGDGKIVVAGESSNGSNDDFALVRYLGTTEPEIAVEQPAGNNLTDGSASIGYGYLAINGGPATRWFTVRNASTASLTGLAVSKDGANSGDFTLGALGATNLGPGESTTFAVSFLPGAAGLRTAAIHIASNDADENPFDIALVGTGLVAPVITTDASLPSGMVGAIYDLTLTASEGTAPYEWSVSAGGLPAGLSLNSAGLLSGTPTSATTANFTVRVIDDYGFSSTKAFALTIIATLDPGDLDLSFGTGGKVTTAIGSADDFGYSVAVQSDGRILVAGYSVISNYAKFALTRYLADGTLDTSFGTGGKVTTSISPYSDYGRSVAVQSDGKILVAGEYPNTSIALVRYETNGTLDTTFGSGGKATPSFGFAFYGRTVMVQSDGKILVAGEVASRCADFGLVRFLADGSLDGTFGSGGIVTTDIGTNSCDYPQGAALQADGRILVAGYAPGTNANDFALLRYLSSGVLDTSFGSGGKVITPVGTYQDYGRSVVVQSDGKIVVAGEFSGGGFALVRYLADGTLDSGFGNGGKVTTAINYYGGSGRCVAVQSDGKIVVAGYCSNSSNDDFALARYNANGTLDASFGTGGKILTPIGSGQDRAYGVALQGDGKIVAAGCSYNGTNYDFALVRYIGSLAPEIAVEQPAGTVLIDGGAGIDFGGAGLGGTPVVRIFTVRNAGTASLTGLAVSQDGANSSDFTVGDLGTTTLAPGASISFTIAFAPGALGPRTAALHIASNDPDENPFDIALAGTGGGTSPLQAWRLIHFGSADNSGDGANLNDFDGDRVQNLLEYAFGGDPKIPDAAAIRPTAVFAGGTFRFSFKCDAHCTDITYTVQASSSLEAGSWTGIARSVGGGTVLPVGSLSEVSDTGIGLRLATVTPSAALFPTGRGFLRIKVSE